MGKTDPFKETLKEGCVYRLRRNTEPDEWINRYGWLWVFLGYDYYSTIYPPHIRARSVVAGVNVLFLHDAFEEPSDARG